ncbi:MAG: HAMP domain-containing histidine kinase [Cyclobacteriaceae bacterium]|jgi:signal transduction histidine kinase|nr:HAMP domain-containing histidine kinase [Cyclobacteriaceae bacterium]
MNLSFKNRIAFFYLIATAMMVALVFIAIYLVIYNRVMSDIEYALNYEAIRHQKEIVIEGGIIRFVNRTEMEEREHRDVEVSPIFIQLVDPNGSVTDRSPNLKEGRLAFKRDAMRSLEQDDVLNGKRIRQLQIPIVDEGKLVGYIITAISIENSHQLLVTLRQLLLVMYPIVLLLLFGVTRWLAGKSIVPVKTILSTTNRITESNLNERIPLPEQKDELHQLTASINQLLARIESAMDREKQFTADASHELRTPLSVLRGTLEVLLRKPRSPEEYIDKIGLSIKEIDRMHHIVEQLLTLARFDHPSKTPVYSYIQVCDFIQDLIQRQQINWSEGNVEVVVSCPKQLQLNTDPGLLEVILDNLLSNAVKYSPAGSRIRIEVKEDPQVSISIIDQGVGIKQDDLDKIFQPFYRSDALNHKNIKGTGLGLSLVQKACDLLSIDLTVESELNKGSSFTLRF